jgi:OmpA-OmpF porin, OOP family
VKIFRTALTFLIAILGAHICAARPQDAKGCQDSPLVSRFPGTVITGCSQKDDDTFTFVLAKGVNKKLEGSVTQISYSIPKTASAPQVLRNFMTAFRSAGYTVERDPSDNSRGNFVVRQNKTWISVEFNGNLDGFYEVILVEVPLTQDVVANAAALTSGLNGAGHIVVSGIHFDTGKADVKQDSAPALEEIVKMLQQNAKTKIYVVGHTDNVGVLAANLDLSRRRAAAVVQMLVTQYHVTADRLQSFGAGPYAPVASNDAEDGRSQNRRVELVKQ